MSRADDPRVRYLGWTLYLFAFLFITAPALEFLYSTWPMRLGQINWRFGTVGLASQSLMVPLLGVFAVVLAANLLGHRVFQLVLAVVNAFLALVGLAVLAVFALDAIQLRPNVAPAAAVGYSSAAIKAAFVQLFTILMLAVFAWTGLKIWLAERKARRRTPETAALVR